MMGRPTKCDRIVAEMEALQSAATSRAVWDSWSQPATGPKTREPNTKEPPVLDEKGRTALKSLFRLSADWRRKGREGGIEADALRAVILTTYREYANAMERMQREIARKIVDEHVGIKRQAGS